MLFGLLIEDMFVSSLYIVQGKTTNRTATTNIFLLINSLIISRMVVN